MPMRVLLVGTLEERSRLRASLENAGLKIVGEFPTIERARQSPALADLIVMPPNAGRGENDPDDLRNSAVETLTAREREVLELLAEGLPNKAIGARLGISDQTVKFHVASIYGKLAASNRTEAVRKGVRLGLVTL
jgi:DNA-binding CsgD family transcriptional regulator